MSTLQALTNALAENGLLQRLCFATLELALLGLVLALVVRIARFESKRLVACLWLIVIAKPLVTLAIGAPITLFEFQVQAREIALTPAPASPPAFAPSPVAVGGIQDRVQLEPVSTEAGAAHAGQLNTLTPESTGAAYAAPVGIATYLLAAWALGVAWFAARYVRVRVHLGRLVRRSVPAPLRVQQVHAALARELGLGRVPAVRVVDGLATPALVGIVRPTVLLPRRLVEDGTAQSTEWALRHELAHWRWRDPLAILVRDAASVCFFFHPAAWWAARRQTEAMEMACDWEALRDPSDAVAYAEGLNGILLLMRDRHPERGLESSLAMATQGRMVRRIRALFDGERARPLTPRGAACVLLVAIAVFAVGCEAKQGDAPPATSDAKPAVRDEARVSKAVADGLCWLARHQNADGSWSAVTTAAMYPCDVPIHHPKNAFTRRYDEGLTGLALLGFLGSGLGADASSELVDAATGKRFRVQDVIQKGVTWLTAKQDPEGNFCLDRPYMYSEAMAGMAVAEAYGLTRDAALADPADRAMKFIGAAQRPSPSDGLWGWRYAARQEVEQFARGGKIDDTIKKELFDSDTSVTSWCTMALRSGSLAGLNVGREHFEGALAFTTFVTAENGMVGYISPKGAGAMVSGPGDHYTYHPAGMSALGMLTRAHARNASDDFAQFRELASKQLVKDLPVITKDTLSIDYYYWYAGTLALSRFDPPNGAIPATRYWGPWRKAVTDAVLELQDKSSNPCASGGWMVADRWSTGVGPIYTTALNVLTLEVCARNPSPQAK